MEPENWPLGKKICFGYSVFFSPAFWGVLPSLPKVSASPITIPIPKKVPNSSSLDHAIPTKEVQTCQNYPLDPKTMKNQGFKTSNIWVVTPKNEGWGFSWQLVVLTRWKIGSQNGSFPLVAVNIKNTWNHHLENCQWKRFQPYVTWTRMKLQKENQSFSRMKMIWFKKNKP